MITSDKEEYILEEGQDARNSWSITTILPLDYVGKV